MGADNLWRIPSPSHKFISIKISNDYTIKIDRNSNWLHNKVQKIKIKVEV